MKTNTISVKNDGTGMASALNEAERFAEYQKFDHKQSLRVRLLAEEMMGLVKNIVGKFSADFWVEGEDKEVSLYLEARCSVDYDQREQLLGMSSSGKNIASKGFMGKLTGVFEYCMMSYDTSIKYGGNDYMDYMSQGYSNLGYDMMWSLSSMKNDLGNYSGGREAKKEEWDELEKSIVAKLADEVLVGVKSNKVQLIIKKSM